MKVDSGASQHSKRKRLTKPLQGSYQREQWMVRDTCEGVVPRLQDPLGVLI